MNVERMDGCQDPAVMMAKCKKKTSKNGVDLGGGCVLLLYAAG